MLFTLNGTFSFVNTGFLSYLDILIFVP